MVWLLIVPLIILWAFVQKAYVDSTGHSMPTRRAAKYQRRKARTLGMDPEEVPYRPRVQPMEKPKLSRKANIVWWTLAAVLWLGILWPRG